VGSVQDWEKVRSNYRDAALGQLDERLEISKSLSQESDNLKAHLNYFIEKAFHLAQPNLRVNGTNFESLDETGRETDVFDETLDRRIWSLADTRLQWHKRIAETRRTVPAEVETTISELLKRHRELDVMLLPVGPEEPHEEELITQEDVLRQQNVEDIFRKTFALSNELDQTVDTQQERGERLKIITSEVKSLNP